MSFTSLLDRFSSVQSPPPAKPAKVPDASEVTGAMDAIYKTSGSNWYSAKPYGFKFTNRAGNPFVMFLPINPSNIQINTNFATNIVATLYGTVEEHSDVRYFDITIAGTTGVAPRYVDVARGEPSQAEQPLRNLGRESFAVADKVPLGGFFSKTLGLANQLVNKATDLISGPETTKTGVYSDKNGYVAFHNLYKFLLAYKKDASGADGSTGERQQHPLTFFNYKDGNQYDVVVRNFVLTKDSSNPMLYNYQITMRGYNLRSVGGEIKEDLQKRYADLGLSGIDSSSLLGDIKGLANDSKAIIGSAVAGINILGR
jgi:hypothetical protein